MSSIDKLPAQNPIEPFPESRDLLEELQKIVMQSKSKILVAIAGIEDQDFFQLATDEMLRRLRFLHSHVRHEIHRDASGRYLSEILKVSEDCINKLVEIDPHLLSESSPETERQEYSPQTREEYEGIFHEELKKGNIAAGIYLREKSRLENKLTRYLLNTGYENIDTELISKERSDLDDAFMACILEYSFREHADRPVSEFGALIANGGNGGERLVPQSDMDYLFILNELSDEEKTVAEKSLIQANKLLEDCDITNVRAAEMLDEAEIRATAQFARQLPLIRKTKRDGRIFQNAIRNIRDIAMEHGIFRSVDATMKLASYIKDCFTTLTREGFDFDTSERSIQKIITRLATGSVTNLEDIEDEEKYQLLINIILAENDMPEKMTRNVHQRMNHAKSQHFENNAKKEFELDPDHETDFYIFHREFDALSRGKEGEFFVRKRNLIRSLEYAVEPMITKLRENMISRHVSGDAARSEKYFQDLENLIAENKAPILQILAEQFYGIKRYLSHQRLNVKDKLYRPIQAAIIGHLASVSTIQHGRIEYALEDMKKKRLLSESILETIRNGLKATDLFRMLKAIYSDLLPTAKKEERKMADVLTPDFLVWMQEQGFQPGKMLTDAQFGLLGMRPFYIEQLPDEGITSEKKRRDGYAERETLLCFEGDIENIRNPADFVMTTLWHIAISGKQPNNKTAVLLDQCAAEVINTNTEKERVREFFLRQLLLLPYFHEAILYVSRSRLLREIYPAYSDIIGDLDPQSHFHRSDETLVSFRYLHSHIIKDPLFDSLSKELAESGNLIALRLALLVRNSPHAVQDSIRGLDPHGVFNDEFIRDVEFLVQHQNSLAPPRDRSATSREAVNGERPIDIIVSSDTSTYQLRRFSHLLNRQGNDGSTDSAEHNYDYLAEAVIALNLIRKISLNPRRDDLKELKKAFERLYMQNRYYQNVKEILNKKKKDLVNFLNDKYLEYLEEIEADTPDHAELEEFFDHYANHQPTIRAKMLAAIRRCNRENGEFSDLNHLQKIESLVEYFDYSLLNTEFEVYRRGKEETTVFAFTESSEDSDRKKEDTLLTRMPKSSASLRDIGILCSNDDFSILQARMTPLDSETMMVRFDLRYSGETYHESKQSLQERLDSIVTDTKDGIRKINSDRERFHEAPTVIINADENSLEIITYEQYVPKYTFSDIMDVFARNNMTPTHFLLATKTRKRSGGDEINGIHDKFFFAADVELSEGIKKEVQEALHTPAALSEE